MPKSDVMHVTKRHKDVHGKKDILGSIVCTPYGWESCSVS